jgi:hypothetical protein
MRLTRKVALIALVVGCRGGGGAAVDGGTPDGRTGDAAPPRGLSVTVAHLERGAEPVYPYNPAKKNNNLVFRYQVTVQNHGPGDLYDLRAVMPVPKVLQGPINVAVDGGWYNDPLKAGLRMFDWLSPEMGPVRFNVTIERDAKLLNADDPDRLAGIIEARVTAHVLQYDREVARGGEIVLRAHTPERINKQDFHDYRTGQVVGAYLYIAGQPRSGDEGGRGGIYRFALPGGAMSKVFQHARAEYIGPFVVEGATVYFASDVADGAGYRNALLSAPADGSGPAKEVILPGETSSIHAVASDATHVYVAALRKDNGRVVHKVIRSDLTTAATSSPMGDLMRYSMAVTSKYVVVRVVDSPALLRLSKDTLEITKLAEPKTTPGERTFSCTETHCYWVEWSGGLFQIPISGEGDPINLLNTNQSIVFDGKQFYSGINGMFRVGPNRQPPAQRLIESGLLPVMAIDDTYLYFGHDARIWRLPK